MAKNILIRKQDNELPAVWLSEAYLLQLLPALTADYLRKKARPAYKASVQPCHRDKSFLPTVVGKSWRFGYTENSFYYDYDSIPNKEPNKYFSQLPTRKQLIELANANKTQDLNSIESFFKPYLNEFTKYLPLYGDCTKTQQQNLAQAASFIEGCTNYILEFTGKKKYSNIISQLSEFGREKEIKYIAFNYRDFRAILFCILQGQNTIHDLVKLPRTGNSNAVKFNNDEEIKSWILNLREQGKNFTNAHIIRKVQWLCSISDKPVPSDRWIGEQMEEVNMKFLASAGRFGAKGRHGQQHRAYTPFANALFSGDCWQLDGTRINLMSFKQKVTVIDELGNEKKVNKEAFLTIVAVRDVHSGDCLGYTFNLAENRWAYIEALKMAVETAGYLPFEIVFDKFPGHNTPEFESFANDLRNRGVKVTFTHLAQGKAKMERWFGTLQTVFMQESNYYYGEGIQSRNAYAHRSKEYLKELRKQASKDGWNWDMYCEEASKIVEAYRNTKYSYYSRKFKHIEQTPAQLHEASEKPNIINIEPYQFAYLFGYKRKAKVANMGLIDFQVNNVTFNYRLANYEAISKNEYVLISYMLEDMSKVEVYELSDRPVKKHLGTADEIPDIVPYGKNAFDGFGKQQAIIKEMEDFRNQELDFRKAVGFDSMAILEQGQVHKYSYEEADAQATKQILFGGDDNIDDYDPTNQY